MSEMVKYLSADFINSLNKRDIINLDKLSLKIGDGIHATPKFIENSHYYFINGNNLSNGKIIVNEKTYCISESEFNKLFQKLGKNTILYSINGTIGNIAFYKGEPVVLGKSVAFIICPTKTIQNFLYYFLQSEYIKNYFDIELTGSTIRNLSLRSIRNTPVLLPNEAEQHKIVSILTTVDNVIEKTEAAIEKYKSLKQGMMNDLFTRGIDPKTNKLRPLYHQASELYKQTELGLIPNDWDIVLLGNYSFITKLAGFEYTMYFDYSKTGSIIAIRALNIKNGRLELSDIHTIPHITSNLLSRSKLYKGDLVISYVGTLGEIAVIPEDNRYHLAPNVAKISVNKDYIEPFFLNELFSYQIQQREIFRLAASTTQSALSMQNLRLIRIFKPPIAEQKSIFSILNDINVLINSEVKELSKYRKIKLGLMQDLLTGKKRVKLDEHLEELRGIE